MNRTATLALIVLSASLLALFVASARTPLGPTSSDYAALVNQAEDSLRSLARGGVGALARPDARSGLEQLTKRPLAPLLSAWSALSLGRVGLVSGSTSVRMPWLILAGLMPVSVFVLLRPRWPASAAFGAAFWLVMSPGFVVNALSVRPSVLAVWSGWLVLVAYACVARERAGRVRCMLLIACAVLAWLAFGLSFGALWVAPLLLLHAWSIGGSVSLRALRRGNVPVPAAALLVIAALPVAVIAFDPLLWHADVPAMIRRVFDEEDPVHGSAPPLTPFVLPCLLALAGLAELSRGALARRFATGEFCPRRDPSALGLLLALGLGLAAFCSGLSPRLSSEFATELLRPILACLVAIGAASLASFAFARHARFVAFAEAGFLLLTLLVR